MLIDNEKFIALLVENSGIEKEKVEKYLEELILDIQTAFEEDEGYEVDGFGIFSKLGANVLFIPSEELETEINYKYVGMEPIELPGGEVEESITDEEEEENPIQGILDGDKPEESADEYEDPFAELFNESEEHEKTQEDELPEEDIEAAVEEEIESEDQEEDVFGEASEDHVEEVEAPFIVDEDIEESLEEIEEEEQEEIISDMSDDSETEAEEKAGPDQWGIDAHKQDDQEGAFSGLFGEEAAESSELIDEEDIFASEEEINDLEEEKKESEEVDSEEEIDFSALEDDAESTENEAFDDPFAELEEEAEEEQDFVPVVTNVSSGKAKDKKEKVVETEEEVTSSDAKKNKLAKSLGDRKKGSPVFLYMILALLILGGTGYALAYFGIVNIEGVTPSKYKTQVAQTTPPVNQQNSTPPQTIESEEEPSPAKALPEVTDAESSDEKLPPNTNNTSTNEIVNAQAEEQQKPKISKENDIAPLIADQKAPGDGGIITPVNAQNGAETYGLKGTATEAGNNGYTIVLYTLSRKAGADAQFAKLSKDGYRAIIKESPSVQYGSLYRVSIGQFKSLADAAIAAEKIDSNILGNYIITKI